MSDDFPLFGSRDDTKVTTAGIDDEFVRQSMRDIAENDRDGRPMCLVLTAFRLCGYIEGLWAAGAANPQDVRNLRERLRLIYSKHLHEMGYRPELPQ